MKGHFKIKNSSFNFGRVSFLELDKKVKKGMIISF